MQINRRFNLLSLAVIATLCSCAEPHRSPLNDYTWDRLARLPQDAADVAAVVQQTSSDAFLETVRQRVIDLLKDPESARFRSLRLVEYKGGLLACGEVNAKNSYGGYVGFAPFLAAKDYVALISEASGRTAAGAVDMSLLNAVCIGR